MESPSPGLKSQPLSMPTRLWPKEATTPRQSGPSSAAALPAKIVLDIETPLFWTNNFTTPTGSVVADGAVGHGKNAAAFDPGGIIRSVATDGAVFDGDFGAVKRPAPPPA